MKLSSLMALKTVVVAVFGISFLFVPTTVMSFFGVTLDPGGRFMAQLFGASFILLGMILWFAKNAPRSEVALRAIVLAVFVGDVIGFVVSLLTQLAGLTNALGWSVVALYLLLALGFGYFQFFKPASS